MKKNNECEVGPRRVIPIRYKILHAIMNVYYFFVPLKPLCPVHIAKQKVGQRCLLDSDNCYKCKKNGEKFQMDPGGLREVWDAATFDDSHIKLYKILHARNKCKKHPRYQAKRKPTANCRKCRRMYKDANTKANNES